MVDIIHHYWWLNHYPPTLVDTFHCCFYSVRLKEGDTQGAKLKHPHCKLWTLLQENKVVWAETLVGCQLIQTCSSFTAYCLQFHNNERKNKVLLFPSNLYIIVPPTVRECAHAPYYYWHTLVTRSFIRKHRRGKGSVTIFGGQAVMHMKLFMLAHTIKQWKWNTDKGTHLTTHAHAHSHNIP